MGKLIYITEGQLQEIIGNGTYLNSNDNSNEYRLGGKEIGFGTTGNYVDGDEDFAEPPISDKIEKELSRPRTIGLGGYPIVRSIRESNQDLTGSHNTMQISDTIVNDLRERLKNYNGNGNEPGVKRAKKIVTDKRISNDDGYRILNDFENGKAGNILTPELQKEIRRRLDTAENVSKTGRDSKIERGVNVLKSAPKTGTKGGAHTPKGNNTIGITYFN